MKIHVRRRHIVAGKRGDGVLCPIAFAYADVGGWVPVVLEDCLEAHDGIHELPRSARRFIARFDAGKPVKPFAFVLK